jgi:hypothetical protein
VLAADNKETDVTVKLTHNKKKEKGVVKMHVKVIDDTPPPEVKQKPDPEPAAVAKKEEPKGEVSKDESRVDDKKKRADGKEEVAATHTEDRVDNNEKKQPEQSPAPEVQKDKEKEVEDATPFEFEKALLCICRVSANNLKDVEKFGKNVSLIDIFSAV